MDNKNNIAPAPPVVVAENANVVVRLDAMHDEFTSRLADLARALEDEQHARVAQASQIRHEVQQTIDNRLNGVNGKLDAISTKLASLTNSINVMQAETKTSIEDLKDASRLRDKVSLELSNDVNTLMQSMGALTSGVAHLRERQQELTGVIFGDTNRPDAKSLMSLLDTVNYKIDTDAQRSAKLVSDVASLRVVVDRLSVVEEQRKEMLRRGLQWLAKTAIGRVLMIGLGGGTLLIAVVDFLRGV